MAVLRALPTASQALRASPCFLMSAQGFSRSQSSSVLSNDLEALGELTGLLLGISVVVGPPVVPHSFCVVRDLREIYSGVQGPCQDLEGLWSLPRVSLCLHALLTQYSNHDPPCTLLDLKAFHSVFVVFTT
ncbi:hypothetical protein H1C71_007996, partial [Ictidomys tridecemlineatus]